MIVTVIATGFGLDANGVAKKPFYNGAMEDISSNGGNYGADDEMDILYHSIKKRIRQVLPV